MVVVSAAVEARKYNWVLVQGKQLKCIVVIGGGDEGKTIEMWLGGGSRCKT